MLERGELFRFQEEHRSIGSAVVLLRLVQRGRNEDAVEKFRIAVGQAEVRRGRHALPARWLEDQAAAPDA